MTAIGKCREQQQRCHEELTDENLYITERQMILMGLEDWFFEEILITYANTSREIL